MANENSGTGKVIIWVTVIAVVAIGGYLTYYYIKKKKEAAASGPRFSTDEAVSIGAGLAGFLKGIFSKNTSTTNSSQSTSTNEIDASNNEWVIPYTDE
jgi:hypothetical protein